MVVCFQLALRLVWALMGQARGIYTFGAHLKWTPVIALGYAASIADAFMDKFSFILS